MREHDDLALELRLRQVLTDRLTALPLDLTVEDVERRRVARRRSRARRGAVLGLGIAAVLVLPVGWLVAGGPRPELQPALVVATPTTAVPTPTGRPAEPTTAATADPPSGPDQAIFLRPTNDAARGLDVIAVRSDGKERRIRHLDAGLTDPGPPGGPFGHVARDGWLAVDVSSDDRGGTWALIDLGDPTLTPRTVSYTPVIGGTWSGTGWFATVTPGRNSGFTIDVVDARAGTTRTIGPANLPGGGPSILWAADGSGIVAYADGGRIGVLPKDGGPVAAGVGQIVDPWGSRWVGPEGATVSICNPPDCRADTVAVRDVVGHDVVWYQGAVAGTRAVAVSFSEDGTSLRLVLDKVVDGRHQPVLAHARHPGEASPDIVATADLGPDVTEIFFAGLARDGTSQVAVNSWIGAPGSESIALAPTVIIPGNGLAPTRHAGRFTGFVPSALADAWAPETSFEPAQEPAIPSAPPAGSSPSP